MRHRSMGSIFKLQPIMGGIPRLLVALRLLAWIRWVITLIRITVIMVTGQICWRAARTLSETTPLHYIGAGHTCCRVLQWAIVGTAFRLE